MDNKLISFHFYQISHFLSLHISHDSLQLLLYLQCVFSSEVTTDNTDNCIELNDNNIVYNQEDQSLTIQGSGKLCDCLQNEFINYRSSIQSIKFEDSITSIGKKCFEHFES